MKNNYEILKQGLFALALTFFSGTAHSQTYTLNYTGSVQTQTLPPGTYGIRMWGADGGNSSNTRAGIGGYSTGTLNLSSTTTLYVVVGGTPIYTGSSGLQPGGYNGGGSGYANATGRAGGGASHIATATGVLSSLASNTSAVIIVAGGGGGDQNAGTIGNGGGSSGGGTYPGTQTGSGGSSTALFGTFGQGGDITTSYGGGGGGGWYGGGGNQNNAGSGGSGYIGGVTNGITSMSTTTGFVTKPITTMDGLVLIDVLCNVSITSSGSNSVAPAICSGQSVTLSTTAVSNFTWSNGNTTNTTIVVSPSSTTSYSVIGTSTANCQAAGNILVTVNSAAPQLTVASVPASSVCSGQSAVISASGAITYTWTGGITNGQAFAPTSTQTYTVSGQNGCGITTATIALTVAPLVVTANVSPTIVCAGSPATLSAVSSVNGYTWQPFSIPGQSIVVSPTVNTVYSVTASNGTCTGNATVALTTKQIPTISIVASSGSICDGDPAYLTASGGTSYTWTPGPLTGANVTVYPTQSTAYVAVGINSLNCTSSANQVILVNPNPTVTATTSSTLICVSSTATLSAGGAHTYLWSTGATSQATLVSPAVTTIYTVVGTYTDTQCHSMQTVTVNIFSPSLTVTSPTTVCLGSSASLGAGGGNANSYVWQPGGLHFASISVTPAVQTTYTVSASTTTAGGVTCPASGTTQVSINPNPTITIVATKTVMCKKDAPATFSATGAVNFTWTATVGSPTNNVNNISVTPPLTMDYTVTGTDINNCRSQASVKLVVNPCTGLSELNSSAEILIYPNPSKGEFFVQSDSNLELNLFNELGQHIKKLQLNDLNNRKVLVKDLAVGIYFIRAQGNNRTINNKLIITD
jgi:hypothetical protein